MVLELNDQVDYSELHIDYKHNEYALITWSSR